MCEHRYLDDPNGLQCTRPEAEHPGTGHTYTATAGPDLDAKRHATGDDQ